MAELTNLTNLIAEGAGGGATLYEIDQVDSQCCGLNKQSVKALFKPSALSVESLDSSMCASQGSTFVVPKHKLTDYEAMETTCCCCMTTTIITLLTTDEDPYTPDKKRAIMFRVAGKLDYIKLDTYIFGPLASAGESLMTFSNLVNDGLMSPIQLTMDRASLDAAAAAPPVYTPSAEPTCKFTLQGATGENKATAQFRTDAVVLDYSKNMCCGCCKTTNHGVIPRYQVRNFTSESASCCCCSEETVTIEQQAKNPTVIPFFGTMWCATRRRVCRGGRVARRQTRAMTPCFVS